jgi:magnesium transporter
LANHPSGSSTPSTSQGPATTLSPILAKSPAGANLPTQPQFAELLTPARLRKKRRHAPQVVVPPGMPTQVGPSRGGYFTTEGDLFRGATQDPTVPTMSRLEEDAVTIGGSSATSSSSSWSWGSGNLERGRRATMAVIGRFGEALGVRRGSETTDSETDTSDDEHDRKSMRSKGTARRRRRSFSNRLSRTISRSTVESSPDRPKRQHVPKRREFTLLVPRTASPHAGPSIMIPTPSTPAPSAIPPTPAAPSHVSERVVTTPSLPDVLKRIRELRLASGMLSTETPPHTPAELAPRRGGSATGHRRGPHRSGAPSFLHPPIPVRPLAARAQTRVEELRAADVPVRPKSVSDLMGLANPYASNTSLPSFKGEGEASKTPSPPVPQPVDSKGKGKAKECWWLDVSCPGWEDLRDIGEVSGIGDS